MESKQIISEFYSSFAKGDHQQMISFYHKQATFQDPAFGKLDYKRVTKMWQMLLSNKSASPKITFSNVKVENSIATAEWKANYFYGPKKRKVENNVEAKFKFKDGKIIEHIDTFDLWKWSRQALGPIGFFLGWTPFMESMVQNQANQKLDAFINKTK